jgi:glycosyltransferase involved in cell wall biosynthesis
VNNKHDLDQAKELRITPKKELILIHNGVDLNKIDFLEKERARDKLELPRDEYIIGTIANFYKTKGLKYLIQAMKEVEDKKLIIIGEGRERKSLEELIKKEGLKDKIKLLGKKKDAYKYLKAFDIFVLSSVKEGFPWVALEAMSARVPVIATRVGAIPEIMTHKENGLIIEPKEPRQIVEALNEIDNLDLVDSAYQTVSDRFSLDKMVSEIESVIDN